MSITVVGSVAFDSVKTPFGERERMLGGAATHFALAASFFEPVNVVGRVGDDFDDEDLAVLTTRGTNVDDLERVSGGRTFFWRGEYGWDLNSRETIETELNVFADLHPNLSPGSRNCDVLFLANVQPSIQRDVRRQCTGARFVALDSMGMWIDTARSTLLKTIRMVDCVVLNDAELRELTRRSNLLAAAREVLRLGPAIVVAKLGACGAALVTADSVFALPAFPVEAVRDPTGAGDTFAGGFVGYIAHHLSRQVDDQMLRQAMAYGTALASFNVEEFGTERVHELTTTEIIDRVGELCAITELEDLPWTQPGEQSPSCQGKSLRALAPATG